MVRWSFQERKGSTQDHNLSVVGFPEFSSQSLSSSVVISRPRSASLTPEPHPHHCTWGSPSEHPPSSPHLWEGILCGGTWFVALIPFPTLPSLLLKDPRLAHRRYWLPAPITQASEIQPLPSCLLCISQGLLRI